MDPATGASTWAFGSQRCTPYSGIFTRNAIRQAAHHKAFVYEEARSGFVY